MKTLLRFISSNKSESKETHKGLKKEREVVSPSSSDSERIGDKIPSSSPKIPRAPTVQNEKILGLPKAALEAFTNSGLEENQVIRDWDIFLRCLYYCTPRHTFEKPPPLVTTPYQLTSAKNSSSSTRLSPSSSSATSLSIQVVDSQTKNVVLNREILNLNPQNAPKPPKIYTDLNEETTEEGTSKKEKEGTNQRSSHPMLYYSSMDATVYTSFHDLSLENTNGNLTGCSETNSMIESLKGTQDLKKTGESKKLVVSTTSKSTKRKKFTQTELDSFVTCSNPSDIFILSRQTGKGSFGKVYVAIRRNDKKKFAIKLMKKNWTEDPQSTAQEISLLSSSHHQNIVGYTNSYLWDDQVWMVMDYCDAGTLNQLIVVDLTESQIACIIAQVLQGLSYLHKMKRIHRDIKSHNILLNMNGDVKVADLGLCMEGEESTSMAGSKYWIAPEVITGRYNNKADIWSAGALVVEMAEGSAPYSQFKALKAMFLTATKGSPSLQNPEKWSETFKDFLRECFIMEVDRRSSAETLLNHPFLKNHNNGRKELMKTMKLVFLLRVTTGL